MTRPDKQRDRALHFQDIVKPFAARIIELMQSLQVLRDSIDAVRAGRQYQMIPLYGQLRALLTDKAKRNSPLLFDIAGQLNDKLEIYAMPGPEDNKLPKDLTEKLFAHLAGFPVGLHRSLPSQDVVPLKKFLERPVYLLRGRKHTSRSIIDLFAQKAGGSHYARKVTREEAELLSSSLLGGPLLNSSLLQLAEMTLALGQRLLGRISKFDFHIVVFAPRQEVKTPRVLLDSQYPESPARFVVSFHSGMKLAFHGVGIDGSKASVVSDREIVWPALHYFWISTELTDQLQTTLRITIDGEDTITRVLPFPLFIPNTLADFDTYWNRSHEDATAGGTFGFAEIAATGGDQSATDRAKLLLHFENTRNNPRAFFCYSPGTFGHAPPGEKNVTNSPGVIFKTFEGLKRDYGLTDEI
jgi:hypothetical protein